MERLQTRELKSPYLKTYVVTRLAHAHQDSKGPDVEKVLAAMTAAAATFDADRALKAHILRGGDAEPG